MGLLDVLGGKQSFKSWATGRDDKEHDVYVNYEKVNIVTDDINSIATTGVDEARDNVYSAIKALNNVNGVEKYMGVVNVNAYDTLFSSISDTIKDISLRLNSKAEDIKAYEESSTAKKIFSTATMATTKAVEGLLSVVEDIGDGVLSVGGFAAGVVGWKKGQEAIGNFVEKDLSHDAFNWYYNSNFAKASAITEDCAISNGFKIAGKTVGYLYAGGVFAGKLEARGFGKATKGLGKVMSNAASSTTWGATIAGTLGGIGSGTESGLNAGLEYNAAFGTGLKVGALQGGLAFVGGKIGEARGRALAVKEAKNAVKAATDATEKAAAESALEAAKATKLSSYQGYTDSITKLGQKVGKGVTNAVSTAAKSIFTKKGAEKAVTEAAKTTSTALVPVEEGASKALTETGKEAATEAAKSVVEKAGISRVIPGVAGVVAGNIINNSNTLDGKAMAEIIDPIKDSGLLEEIKSGDVFEKAYTPSGKDVNTINHIDTTDYPYVDNSDDDNDTDNGTNNDTDTSTDTDTDNGYNNNNNDNDNNTDTGTDYNYDNGYTSYEEYPTDFETIDNGSFTAFDPVGPSNNSDNQTPSYETIDVEPVPVIDEPPQDSGPSSTYNNPPQQIVIQQQVPQQQSGTVTYVPEQNNDNALSINNETPFEDEVFEDDSFELEDALDLDTLDDVVEEEPLIDELVSGDSYSKLPTSSAPAQTSKKKSSKSAIPIAAGLSVAAAAGLGAKAYMDWKKNNSDDEEEEEFDSDEWDEEKEPEENNEYVSDLNYMNNLDSEELEEDDGSYKAKSSNELVEV